MAKKLDLDVNVSVEVVIHQALHEVARQAFEAGVVIDTVTFNHRIIETIGHAPESGGIGVELKTRYIPDGVI